MRAVRIAAFTLAGVLACVVISHIFTIEPGVPQEDHSADADSQAGPPPTVPPPPPLAGTPAAQPARKRPAPAKVASEQPQLTPPQNAAQDLVQPDAKPSIWTGDNTPVEDADSGSAATPVETASVEQPKAPVIVVPHERPKEDSRGVRWLKAVGHALGIGGTKDPAEQAFQ